MKSADCRRVSDAEHSVASSHGMTVTVKVEPFIKEEPVWVELDASEAAAEAGLYADHKIKDELVFGPEMLQQQDIAISMRNMLCKEEKHPCKLEPADGAGAENTHTSQEVRLRCNNSLKDQFKLKSCSVRLQRIPLADLLTSKTCHKTFDCKSSLSNHTDRHIYSRETPCPCQVCVLPQDLNNPTQTDEKLHSCSICHKPFTKQSDLTRHVRIHTGEKPYSCDKCHKRFADQSRLSRHIRIHAGDEPLRCNVCHKRFVQQSNLDKHMLTHMGDKPYTCNVCNKRFTKQSDMTRHVRVHTGEKPYLCHTCNKQFADPSRLSRHVRIHAGVEPHGCNVCHKRFKQKAHLTRHTQIHTGEKPFSCHECGKRFIQKPHFKKHLQAHVGENIGSTEKNTTPKDITTTLLTN